MASQYLLTGPPGVGKTSLLLSLVETLPGKKGGLYTREIREGRQRSSSRSWKAPDPSWPPSWQWPTLSRTGSRPTLASSLSASRSQTDRRSPRPSLRTSPDC
ncbi:MAG: nucleoside-triphosphatase [Candidatus Methylomirabilales bacterium]